MSGQEKIVQLYSAAQVRQRLDELAHFVNADYRGQEVLLLSVLNGARKITDELAARMRVPIDISCVTATSYEDNTEPQKRVEVRLDTGVRVAGRHVLLVDDIADTGCTLSAVAERVTREGPRSLKTFVLTNKPQRRIVRVPLDYVAFAVPNRFIVGFGMGLGERFRDLPFLGYLKESG